MLKLEIKSYQLDFTFSAGTSRGVMHHHRVWLLKIYDELTPEVFGLGEAAPLPRLSVDDIDLMDQMLDKVALTFRQQSLPQTEEEVFALAARLVSMDYPSIRFGLEVALLDLLRGGHRKILENPFSTGQKQININGLIWMGDAATMRERIEQKISEGFDCIKMKIGAIDFEREVELLRYLRSLSEDLILRVDANGAFNVREALGKLKALASVDIHSIEQPVLPNQHEAMQLICKIGALDVALDEELIGRPKDQEKVHLLEFLKPKYIVLKPTLVGGIAETRKWIEIAESLGIAWWITSALESNIGLNAICQLTAQYENPLHQGLGTGQLYSNNIGSPLRVEAGKIRYDSSLSWADPFTI